MKTVAAAALFLVLGCAGVKTLISPLPRPPLKCQMVEVEAGNEQYVCFQAYTTRTDCKVVFVQILSDGRVVVASACDK